MNRIARAFARQASLPLGVTAALALASAPAAAQQNVQPLADGCMYVIGLGQAIPCQSASTPGELMITLNGSFDILSRNLADGARVRCWVCEGDTCDDTGPYGPAESTYELSPSYSDEHQTADWSVFVHFSATAVNEPAVFPTFESYYCRMETLLSTSAGGYTTSSWAVPSYYGTHPAHRAEDGTELVTEFQGTFVEPVTGVKTKN
ncbi:MAG: hypothetical protein RJQ04_04020 [Longimicrobiales bacterium]